MDLLSEPVMGRRIMGKQVESYYELSACGVPLFVLGYDKHSIADYRAVNLCSVNSEDEPMFYVSRTKDKIYYVASDFMKGMLERGEDISWIEGSKMARGARRLLTEGLRNLEKDIFN
ncbi:hypothetical protein HN903_01930 [archaeon]|nr:hypothetical protein [archaeon]MBT6955666.1 hypothetical protein [archaeon]MBT7128492.1 hypothetical protein [archaeon]